ncbi:hypothetical protein GFS31_39780 [Leptolyngbya sp. BL0902]|uniref:hypothetical protein n=1 Tax=Leptolyngbya sp. BL0902 TaxID=1115757 RepID=UPI0018E85383|nr:hypothetical protein [Leptolyngbya sp. BL0902]QQE67265.1 hypothetical protein GFS31_39780 [Leptolyngbya sp. BL0902]
MCRLLATTVLAGVGVLFSHPALAQVITFPAQTPGVLVQPAGNPHRLQTGVNGTVTVSVVGGLGVTLQVAAPTFVSGPGGQTDDPPGTIKTATATWPTGSATSGGGAAPFPTALTTVVSVSMAVDRQPPNFFAPGLYNYQVVLTVAAP